MSAAIAEVGSLAGELIHKDSIDTVQINIGDKCNQKCFHCHIGASPSGKKAMEEKTAELIVGKLALSDIGNVEFTGGTPELVPSLKVLIEGLSGYGKRMAVRTSLTVLDDPEYSSYLGMYRKHNIGIIASLPGVFEDVTDRQRGKGVFEKSIRMLRRLNELGYGTGGLPLDIVYNPAGDYLPPDERGLEREYRQLLGELYNIRFNRLITIVNAPIRRFRKYLDTQGRLGAYIGLLRRSFNPETLGRVMCRRLVSIDYRGHVYDCDFNLALGIRMKGFESQRFWEIDLADFRPEVTFGEHCYACTAGRGSSCSGPLLKRGPGCPAAGGAGNTAPADAGRTCC